MYNTCAFDPITSASSPAKHPYVISDAYRCSSADSSNSNCVHPYLTLHLSQWLTHNVIKRYLGSFSEQTWPDVVKWTFLIGVIGLRKSMVPTHQISLHDLIDIAKQNCDAIGGLSPAQKLAPLQWSTKPSSRYRPISHISSNPKKSYKIHPFLNTKAPSEWRSGETTTIDKPDTTTKMNNNNKTNNPNDKKIYPYWWGEWHPFEDAFYTSSVYDLNNSSNINNSNSSVNYNKNSNYQNNNRNAINRRSRSFSPKPRVAPPSPYSSSSSSRSSSPPPPDELDVQYLSSNDDYRRSIDKTKTNRRKPCKSDDDESLQNDSRYINSSRSSNASVHTPTFGSATTIFNTDFYDQNPNKPTRTGSHRPHPTSRSISHTNNITRSSGRTSTKLRAMIRKAKSRNLLLSADVSNVNSTIDGFQAYRPPGEAAWVCALRPNNNTYKPQFIHRRVGLAEGGGKEGISVFGERSGLRKQVGFQNGSKNGYDQSISFRDAIR